MNQEHMQALTAGSDGALTPQQLTAAAADFAAHYQLPGNKPVPDQLSFPFRQLQEKVTAFMTAEQLPEREVGCIFIHRFEVAANRWYACLELARMADLKQKDPYGRSIYELTPFPGYRYDILNGLTASTLQGSYDPNYFSHVLYVDKPGESLPVPLVYGQNVQSVAVPWMRELLRLCQQNQLQGVAGAQLVLQSIASKPSYPSDALVNWPHALAFYMRDAQGHDCLGAPVPNFVFRNQAADMVTSCPANCKKYLMPENLPA